MALIPPKVRQLVRSSPEDRAARSQEWDIERAQRDQKRIDERPRRRAAIELGPPLRDVDAAVECHCGCHPRPAELETHDGGVSCNCQLTPAEREAIWKEFEDFEPDPELVVEQRMRTEEFDREATGLGVQATVRVEAFPFVIGGVVDGRGFYMRERGGSYRITIAHDDNPLDDPWSSDAEVPTIDIAVGSEAEFRDEDGTPSQTLALQITVQSIRTYLLRRNCSHETPANATHRFCRHCGIELPAN
jgi:hypothetical protein